MPYDSVLVTPEQPALAVRAMAALDPAAVRRRERDEQVGLEMLSNLERQAKAILALAAASEQPQGIQTFAACRKFRLKLGEFEAFCNVIEGQLRKLAGDSKSELDELFHKRRTMILRPSVRALTAIFGRLAQDGLPFGLLDALQEELRALEDMRALAGQADSSSEDDRMLLHEIDKLECVIQSLSGNATEFVELTPVAFEPIAQARTAAPAQAAAAAQLNSPTQKVLAKIRDLLTPCRDTAELEAHANSDLRALDDIERRLSDTPEDRDAVAWLRDICKRWASKLREHNGEFIRLATSL